MRDGLERVQSAAIFGGGSDIGMATARMLARERARAIVLAGRKPERFEPAVGELRRSGATEVSLVEFDADAFETHERVVDEVFERVGDLDLALLSFGVLGDQRAAERDPAVAVEIARTNYLGAVSLLVPLADRMTNQGHGTIAVLSSVAPARARTAATPARADARRRRGHHSRATAARPTSPRRSSARRSPRTSTWHADRHPADAACRRATSARPAPHR